MRGALLGGLVLLVASPAWADAPAMVFPLSPVRLPPALAEAPDQLTRALAGAIEAEVASVPIEDAAGLLECDPEATPCLEAVAKSMGAGRIVFGTITATSDTALKVTLTRFDPGPTRQQRTFDLAAATVPELADALVTAAAPLFGKGPALQVTDPGSPLEPTPDPASVSDEPPRGRISPATWAILGGGAAATGVGIAFWVSARGLRDDVANAPRETREDLDALVALEDTGTFRTRFGGALTAVGGIALAYGVYRVVTERRRPAERDAVVVTPVPIEGGAAIVLTLGIP